jgi:hypothetical protein
LWSRAARFLYVHECLFGLQVSVTTIFKGWLKNQENQGLSRIPSMVTMRRRLVSGHSFEKMGVANRHI